MNIEERKTIAAVVNMLVEKMSEHDVLLTKEILSLINIARLEENKETKLYEPKED